MKKSKRLTKKVRDVLSQGQSSGSVGGAVSGGAVAGVSSTPSGVGDSIRGGAGPLGPSYSAAPGTGSSSSSNGSSNPSSIGYNSIGYGWGRMLVGPMLACTCPKCKRASTRPSDLRCGDTSCPYCGTKMKPFVQR